MGKKITFTEDHTVPDKEAKEYKEGKTYPVTDDTARHFIRRGMAFDQDSADAAKSMAKRKAEDGKDAAKAKSNADAKAKSEAKAEKEGSKD